MSRKKAPSVILVTLLTLAFTLPLHGGATTSARVRVNGTDQQSNFEPLPNIDARDLRAPGKQRSGLANGKQKPAVNSATEDAVLTWDDRLDLPHSVISFTEPLTVSSNEDPDLIAKRFVRDNSSLFGISDDELESSRVTARETTGFTRLALEQQANGIRVFDSEMLFVLDSKGRVRSESGSFIPEIERLAGDGEPTLSAEQAFHRAVSFCGAELSTELRTGVVAIADNSRGHSRIIFQSDEVDPRSEASLVYYPIARDEIRLAYQILLYGVPTLLDAYLLLVDARTGALLRRDSLTYASEPPTGRVFTRESPAISERQIVPFAGDPVASPAGWVTANRTGGNNARVFFNPALNGGTMTKSTPEGNFDFAIDLTPGHSPLNSSDASSANLFYWVNVAHDRFYALGFNEATRNFQSDNFGKGGRDSDQVRAETLRGAAVDPSSTTQLVRNNAYFQTSLDGTPPLLAMLMWSANVNGQIVDLDSSYDAGVIIHEYTHGVSTRLSGTDTSTGLRSNQGGGMGEGWSDFFAMSFLNGDLPVDGAFPTGSYITQQAHGVRNFPYSTRFDVDPLTFGDISSYNEVHAQGAVWCSILWEMRQALVGRFGFQAGRDAAERLVVNGLKVTPLAPTFVDARDAILLADRITNSGTNQDLIWRAFARRGLGKSAVTSLTTSGSGFRLDATEGYDVPAEFSAGSLVVNDKPSTRVAIGEPLPLIVVDRDVIAASVEVRATNLRTGETAVVPLLQTSPGRFAGFLRCLFPGQDGGPGIALAAQPGDPISIKYSNARNDAGQPEDIEVQIVAGRRVEVYASDFETGVSGWTLTNLWHVTERRSASATHSLYFAKQKGANEAKSFTPAGTSGSAYAPGSDLRNLTGARLEFDYAFIGAISGEQTSLNGDVLTLSARNYPFVGSFPLTAEDPRLQVFFDLRPDHSGSFHQATVDLRYLGSRSAYFALSFSASTADIARKKLEGFYVDNIRVTAVSTE